MILISKIRSFLFTLQSTFLTGISSVLLILSLLLQSFSIYAQNSSNEPITKWILQLPDSAFGNTTDDLNQHGKNILLKNGKYIDTVSRWVIKEKQANKLRIRSTPIEGGSWETVTFWLIKGKNSLGGNTNFLIEQTENGESISIQTWTMKNNKIQPITLFKTPTANDFLDKPVPGGENQGGILCSICDSGYKISCEPWTWMESFWEKHKIIYNVTFKWNSKYFVLHRKHK